MTNKINGFFPGRIFPQEVLAGCIEIFENVWPNNEETIESLEEECLDPESNMFWVRAETLGQGVMQDKRTNFNINLSYYADFYENKFAQALHNQIYVILLAATIPYAEKHQIPNLYHEDYSVLRYRSGQEYKAHADGSTDIGRSISAVFYLNDDYEGGEIEFVNFNIKIKPKAGSLILFPSNYPYAHIAHPVTGGTKYAIVTWIKDRIV